MMKKKYTKQGDNIASEVIVTYDPSLIKKNKNKRPRTKEEKRLDEELERKLRSESLGNKLSKMGFESSLGKDERKFELQAKINRKEVFTVLSAMEAMALSKGTIITYLKEIGLQLWDTEDEKFVGAKDGKRIGLD